VKLSVVGIHRIPEAPEPCHLIELQIDGSESLDIGSITQEAPGRDPADWQVLYDEHVLTPDGEQASPVDGSAPPPSGRGSRVAFFFHYLAKNRPLLTPMGSIPLPEETPIPERLRFMKYEQP
jgi:hypothetical protein